MCGHKNCKNRKNRKKEKCAGMDLNNNLLQADKLNNDSYGFNIVALFTAKNDGRVLNIIFGGKSSNFFIRFQKKDQQERYSEPEVTFFVQNTSDLLGSRGGLGGSNLFDRGGLSRGGLFGRYGLYGR
jgi:hypothetical protein